MKLNFKNHISSELDLKTTYEEYRAGFIAFALEKNKRSTPFIERAKVLKSLASDVHTPKELLMIDEIQDALLYASGISEKAKKFLTEDARLESIKSLIENFLEPAGDNFLDELVFRYLLFQGDSLGGKMRNIAGVIAQQKLTRTIISILSILQKDYHWLDSRFNNKQWLNKPSDDYELETFAKGISWVNNGIPRTLLYNITVPIIKNNVDFCLFDCSFSEFNNVDILSLPEKYILLGELKGGIDPAGADEHWKTANTALNRIRSGFNKLNLQPLTAFIGAAIESKMAREIWDQLQDNQLSNAANLTNTTQINSLCTWLVNL